MVRFYSGVEVVLYHTVVRVIAVVYALQLSTAGVLLRWSVEHCKDQLLWLLFVFVLVVYVGGTSGCLDDTRSLTTCNVWYIDMSWMSIGCWLSHILEQ